jgi:hypothetical protein
VVADPFAHTAHLVALLRQRAKHVWQQETAANAGRLRGQAWRLRPL